MHSSSLAAASVTAAAFVTSLLATAARDQATHKVMLAFRWEDLGRVYGSCEERRHLCRVVHATVMFRFKISRVDEVSLPRRNNALAHGRGSPASWARSKLPSPSTSVSAAALVCVVGTPCARPADMFHNNFSLAADSRGTTLQNLLSPHELSAAVFSIPHSDFQLSI